MIRYTTAFHLLANLVIIALAFVCWALCSEIIAAITSFFGVLTEYNSASDLIGGVAAIPLWLGVGYLVNPFLETLASYCYLRADLRASVSFSEARRVSFLFTPNTKGKWYPLDEVEEMPKEERRAYVLAFAESVTRTESP